MRVKWKWRRKRGYWYLARRGKQGGKLAELFQVPKGWLVVVLPDTFAGPYGDFNLARQAAETRVCR